MVEELKMKESEVDQCLYAGLADLEDRKLQKMKTLEVNFDGMRKTRMETFKKYVMKRNL